MQGYLEFAIGLARVAGRLIKEGFDHEHTVADKADDSPVTEVDTAINQLVISRLQAVYPKHGLLGEELNYGSGSETYRWICDPLDGTKAYILGVPNSVFILSLMKQESLQLAVIYDPFNDRLWHALRGKGSFCNGQRISVSQQPLAGGYVLLGSSTYPFIEAIEERGGRVEPVSGGGYKYAMIASGRAVGTIKDGADFHDVAAGALLIEEAGGKVTALDGAPLVLDQKISGAIMSNTASYGELLEIAKRAKSHDFTASYRSSSGSTSNVNGFE